MDAFARMLADSMGGSLDEMKPISAEDVEKGFDAIPDLKKGDRVQWKSEAHKNSKVPAIGQPIIVHSVQSFNMPQSDGGPYDNLDFSALFVDGKNGRIIDYAFDSRRFERVE